MVASVPRKRKWDQTGPDAGGNDADAALDPAAAAKAAAAKLSQSLQHTDASREVSDSAAHSGRAPESKTGGLLGKEGGGGGGGEKQPTREVEINDRANRRHAISNIKTVEARTGAAIVTRGVYYPPDADPPPPPSTPNTPLDKRKLYLLVTAESADVVDRAVTMIESYLNESLNTTGGNTVHGSSGNTSGTIAGNGIDRVWCDMDIASAPGFDVLERLRGPGREYFQFIERESGATVELAGRGAISGYARENLHIAIRAPSPKANVHARSLCMSLVHAIQPIFNEYRQKYFPHNVRSVSRGGSMSRPTRPRDYGRNPMQPQPQQPYQRPIQSNVPQSYHHRYGPHQQQQQQQHYPYRHHGAQYKHPAYGAQQQYQYPPAAQEQYPAQYGYHAMSQPPPPPPPPPYHQQPYAAGAADAHPPPPPPPPPEDAPPPPPPPPPMSPPPPPPPP